MPMLIQACPSFQALSQDKPGAEDKELLYPSLGLFADHLLELYRQGCTTEFQAVAEAIERLHLDGGRYVKEAATIGLIEGIQNGWGNKGADPEHFATFLRPESAKWWRSLNDFWSGKVNTVGEGL